MDVDRVRTIACVIERVEVVDTARPRELAEVEDAMARFGFGIDAIPAHHPAQDHPTVGEAIHWIVTVTLAVPIGAFFAAIAQEAGKDAYRAIKRWASDLSAASPPHGYGDIEVLDPDGSRIDLRPVNLPDEAFAALLDIDWAKHAGATLIWTDEHGWVDSTWYLEEVVKPGLEDGSFFRSRRRPGDSL